MDMNILPQEILKSPEGEALLETIKDSFYDIFAYTFDLTKDKYKSAGFGDYPMGIPIVKIYTANLLKESFDRAYKKFMES